jgi:hypothetical protein
MLLGALSRKLSVEVAAAMVLAFVLVAPATAWAAPEGGPATPNRYECLPSAQPAPPEQNVSRGQAIHGLKTGEYDSCGGASDIASPNRYECLPTDQPAPFEQDVSRGQAIHGIESGKYDACFPTSETIPTTYECLPTAQPAPWEQDVSRGQAHHGLMSGEYDSCVPSSGIIAPA